jgi:hypothetical protein
MLPMDYTRWRTDSIHLSEIWHLPKIKSWGQKLVKNTFWKAELILTQSYTPLPRAPATSSSRALLPFRAPERYPSGNFFPTPVSSWELCLSSGPVISTSQNPKVKCALPFLDLPGASDNADPSPSPGFQETYRPPCSSCWLSPTPFILLPKCALPVFPSILQTHVSLPPCAGHSKGPSGWAQSAEQSSSQSSTSLLLPQSSRFL